MIEAINLWKEYGDNVVLERLNLEVTDIDRLFVAGGFGNYINVRNAIAVGLFPDLPTDKIQYAGNTSIWGAKLAAFSSEARETLREITNRTTNYDLMGTPDYVEQFKQAMFLPHTDARPRSVTTWLRQLQ